jgi:hypothetical protein
MNYNDNTKSAFYVENVVNNNGKFNLISLKPIAIGTIESPIFQSQCAIAIGDHAGFFDQGECAIAIGENAGMTFQGINSISLGPKSGQKDQGDYSIAIGYKAGQTNQHSNSIILNASGNSLNSVTACSFYVNPVRQGTFSHILYYNASTKEICHEARGGILPQGTTYGQYLFYDETSWQIGTTQISIGALSGQYSQGSGAIAIGNNAGHTNQGINSVAIGSNVGTTNQPNNTIMIGATGTNFTNSTFPSATYIDPIRNSTAANTLYYNPTTKEIVYNTTPTVIPPGTTYGQYLFYNGSAWVVGTTQISIGALSGQSGQSSGAIAIGYNAGHTNQGINSIAIGSNVGTTNQPNNTIMIGATGTNFSTATSNACYINPIRSSTGANFLYYNSNNEVVKNQNLIVGPNGSSFSDMRSATLTFTNVQINQLQSVSQTFTYPTPFSGTPVVIGTADYPFSVNFSNITNTSCRVYIINLGPPQGSPTNINCNLFMYL